MNIRVHLADGSHHTYQNAEYTVWKDSGCLSIHKASVRIAVYSPSGWMWVDPNVQDGTPSVHSI